MASNILHGDGGNGGSRNSNQRHASNDARINPNGGTSLSPLLPVPRPNQRRPRLRSPGRNTTPGLLTMIPLSRLHSRRPPITSCRLLSCFRPLGPSEPEGQPGLSNPPKPRRPPLI